MSEREPRESRSGDLPAAVAAEPDLEGGGSADAVGTAVDPARYLLERAAREVEEEWADRPGGTTPQGLQSELRRIVELVETVAETGTLSETPGEATALRLRLVDELRRHLLGTSITGAPEGESPSSDDVLRTLRSLESLRQVLEADWARRFGLALAGPHGVDLAAEIAHGLRSSCTSLLFVAEVLRDGIYGELNEKQRQQVEILYGAAVALTTSLSDITELSWRTEEPGEGRPEAFRLDELAGGVRRLLEPVAAGKGTRLVFDLEVGSERMGHPRALRQILLNLLLHSLFRAEGGRVSLSVRSRDDEPEVEFRIRTDGEEAEDRNGGDRYRILRQALTEGEYSFSAPGLRLHMARYLVRATGGVLEHVPESDGSVRTSFRLDLPPRRAGDPEM